MWKLEEEICEHKEALGFDDCIKELADVVIVCCGLYRWCPMLATTVYYDILDSCIYDWEDDLEAEVARKWQINLKRKWAWNGKTYHHVEAKDED